MTDLKEYYEWMFYHRNIETPCTKCSGFGRRAYANTTTWRGGIGGQMITGGVCDHCWGSGDENRHGTNLRELYAELEDLKADFASERRRVDYLREDIERMEEGMPL